ncbi:MAG: hypothetical protein ABIZ34_01455, partial [Candidatus Limnocylindrales bacterium]
MGERLISAAVLVPAVVVVFLVGQPWLTITVALVSIIAASEAFRLLRAAGLPGDPGVGVIAAPLAVIGTLRPSLATGVGIGAIVIIAS